MTERLEKLDFEQYKNLIIWSSPHTHVICYEMFFFSFKYDKLYITGIIDILLMWR